MKSLFTDEAINEIKSRIDNLSNESPAQWGDMDVSQMLAHCQFPLQVAVGKLSLEKPNTFKRLLFSMFKSSLYNDKPWKQGLPTTKAFMITDEKDFNLEKNQLLLEIQEFHNKKTQLEWPPHPMFGNFTQEQWGQMQYKHLDHHLKQFGA